METFKQRLKSFLNTDIYNIPERIFNSIENNFLPELELAEKNKQYQLIILGTHAIIQIVSEKIFGKKGLKGTKFYLENFIDGTKPDRKFSYIYKEIHDMRNSLAHMWFSKQDDKIAINNNINEGWKFESESEKLLINLDIYLEQFLDAFKRCGRIWDYEKLIKEEDLLIQKYFYIIDWLDLNKKNKNNSIVIAINKLSNIIKNGGEKEEYKIQEKEIIKLIYKEYKL